MRALVLLLLLAACAHEAPSPGPATSDARDCAVLAAVIQNRFPEGLPEGPALKRRDDDFAITCDFSAKGLFVPDLYTDRAQGTFWFVRPEYPSANAAVVRIGVQLAPMVGYGQRCMLTQAAAGWAVDQCVPEWMS
jgi:hypothetical protein